MAGLLKVLTCILLSGCNTILCDEKKIPIPHTLRPTDTFSYASAEPGGGAQVVLEIEGKDGADKLKVIEVEEVEEEGLQECR